MSTQNNTCAPRLRFLGFTGEWKEVLVKDICNINTGKSNTQDQVPDGKYPFYIRSAYPVRSNRYLYDCEAVITIGDGQIGKVFHYVNGKFDLHQRCYMMSNFTDVNCRYFYYYFSEHFYERAMRMTAKATVDSVRLEMISEMPILLPPTLAEQQKIAECLTEMDKTIASQAENVEALKEKKKGLMQQLFPQNGETTPRLRFPGFEGEWEEKKLGEVGTFIRGLSYNNSEVTQDTFSTLVIRSNNIIPDSIVDCKNGLVYVTKEPSKEQILRKGDVVVCLANGSSNLVGKSSSFNGDYSGPVTVGAFCGIYRSELPICKYLVQTAAYKEKINLIKQGGNGALANLYGKDILELVFCLPSPAEQNKIVECLSALDDQIAAESAKLEALKDHKKGLMQQLFPEPAK